MLVQLDRKGREEGGTGNARLLRGSAFSAKLAFLLARASQQRCYEIVVENALRIARSAIGVEGLDSSTTALREIRQETRVERWRERSSGLTRVVEAEHLAGVWHSSQRNPDTLDVCEEMK